MLKPFFDIEKLPCSLIDAPTEIPTSLPSAMNAFVLPGVSRSPLIGIGGNPRRVIRHQRLFCLTFKPIPHW